jgi:serine/threonine-protein kinase
VDGRADIYSLGVVMYEMLSGVKPFTGETAVNVLFQHLEAEVQPLFELVPDVPDALGLLVMRAMSRDRDKRPSSAAEMGQQLRAQAA